MKMEWSTAVYQLQKQGKAYVIATIVGITGSTPRSSGTKMVIARDQIFDSLGGGHLEHKVIQTAHKLLSENVDCQRLEHFELGIHLDQCCGGSANVLLECFAANHLNIMLFGAGHVGQALVPILASLPCQISWVDSRDCWLSESVENFQNVKKIISDNPQQQVANMPADSYYIVMTHKHQMDFDICHEIIQRSDYRYLGLIGSQTKWRRFKQRYVQRNITLEQLKSVNCPIGLAEVSGKRPAEVAVSVAAEIIAHYQALSRELQKGEPINKGIHWRQLKPILEGDRKTSKEKS